jgi:hypothetical protein
MVGIAAHVMRLCLGAGVVGWLLWRHRRQKISESPKDPFQLVLACASDNEIKKLHADYEALVSLDVNPEFVYKLDICTAEMRRRGLSPPQAEAAEAKTVMQG